MSLFTKQRIGTALLGVITVAGFSVARGSVQDPLIERGHYLVGYGSCNDCHTPGWRESDGTIPVSRWMTGSSLGYRGPWGTSY
ncbi:MAG: cytochrome C, partial [Candidatus Eremiobacteraeota bacterium]|nr:cytochrome C [Candidatus Eremiobacteraeota bacterium]